VFIGSLVRSFVSEQDFSESISLIFMKYGRSILSAAILDIIEPEIAPFDPPTPKTLD